MLRRYFRKKRLRQDSSGQPTGFIPVEQIKYMAVILDVADPEFPECRDAITAYCRKTGMALNMMYIDFRRGGIFSHVEKLCGEHRSGAVYRPATDRDMTFFRRDLNWLGKPSAKKAGLLKDNPCDLYICLADRRSYCIEYLSSIAAARFKIGRTDFRSAPFDMVVSEAPDGPDGICEIFRTITEFLAKIR